MSCPVLMPTVVKLTAGKNLGQNWPQLICTAGGMDTALSVGVSGVIHSFIMYEGDDAYRYIRVSEITSRDYYFSRFFLLTGRPYLPFPYSTYVFLYFSNKI